MIERRRILKFSAACLAAVAAPHGSGLSAPAGPQQAGEADEFGGTGVAAGGATGFFRVAKVGSRWLFVTPNGQAFFMTGVYAVIFSDENLVKRKYGDTATWAHYTARRLKSWSFNTLAEYYHRRLERERMPFVAIIKPSGNALTNRWGFGPRAIKDLISLTDAKVYRGWRGSRTPDVWDPAFEAYIDGWLRRHGDHGGIIDNPTKSPWLMGIATDDTDYLFGFGPGPEPRAARMHPHLGWIVLVANFEQKENERDKVSYEEPKVYSKYALRDFLKTRHQTIDELNAAWGSTYTAFDSAGGWGRGTGLLDENGHNRWAGQWRDDGEPLGMAPAVKSDLDAFLYQHAKRYFSVVTSKLRQYAPRHLVFGPAFLNGWGGLTREGILRAAGETVDVVQVAIRDQQAL